MIIHLPIEKNPKMIFLLPVNVLTSMSINKNTSLQHYIEYFYNNIEIQCHKQNQWFLHNAASNIKTVHVCLYYGLLDSPILIYAALYSVVKAFL